MNKPWLLLASIAIASCGGGGSEGADPDLGVPEFEPPVVVNSAAPVEYPPDLYEDGVQGIVMLRLYVDEDGNVVPDSTRIEEPSGYPKLDSAALAGVDQMQFAPARRHGEAVATLFLQPVHFRRPESATRPGAE